MKQLLALITLSILLASCGRVLSPDELLNPNYDHAKKSDVDAINERLTEIENRLDQAYSDLDSLNQSVNDLEVNQDALSQSVSLNLARIIELENALQGQSNVITGIIDPCGDNVGQFDEVLFQLKDSQGNTSIIGYFEQGNKRYLSTLPDGNYRTTDNQACNFSIVNGEYQP